MTKIFIKPKHKELFVPKPDGSRLKSEGEYVEPVIYWHRRIKDNEVEVVKNPKQNAKDK